MRHADRDRRRAGASAAQRDPYTGERLEELDAQLPGLLHRHKQARDALLSTYGASLIFIGDMFVIALAATTGSAWLANVVLIVFLSGIGVLFVGLLLILLEVNHLRPDIRQLPIDSRPIPCKLTPSS